MNKKLGFMLDNLGPNQLAASIVVSGNMFVENHSQSDLVVFHKNIFQPCYNPNFGFMDMAETFNFDGVAIATNFNTAEYLLKCPGPHHKIFYIWDLEWVFSNPKNYTQFSKIYNNPQFDFVARSETHAKVIEDAWNVKISEIIPGANVTAFYEYAVKAAKPPKRRTFVEGLFYAKS